MLCCVEECPYLHVSLPLTMEEREIEGGYRDK